MEPERRRPRLGLGGLRWRLAAWVAVVVVVSSAITFVVVYSGTGTQLRQQIDRELSGDIGELSRALAGTHAGVSSGRLAGGSSERLAGVSSERLAGVAARYVSGQPFSASSTVLFATVPGQGTQTNTPELFARTGRDDGESAATQAAENRAAGRLLGAPSGYSTVHLADAGDMRLLKRKLRLGGSLNVTVGVAEPLAAVSRAQHGVARAFILAGALTLVGALLGALLIGSRFSAPLRRMAAVAARVDAGDLEPRIERVRGPGEEVRVLAETFNHMLDRLTDAFASQREFVADASHELRTPLTVIRGQLEVLAARRQSSPEEVRRVERMVQGEIARISRLIDDLLLLAKAEQTEFLRAERIELPGFVSELWDGISLIADRRFELSPVPAGTLRTDPDRLAQALRNLIANAIEHTRDGDGLVRMRVECSPQARLRPGWVAFVLEDDGEGIPPEQLQSVFDRFHRTDAARDRASGGTGLGLAIVKAIAEAHGGSVSAAQAPSGGAMIVLELPGFAPSQGLDAAERAPAHPAPAHPARPQPQETAMGSGESR